MIQSTVLMIAIAITSTFGNGPQVADTTQATDEKTALVEQLLKVTQVEELTKVAQLEGFKAGLEMGPVPIPADKKAKIIEVGTKVMEEVMPWSVMKKDYIELYSKHYTIDELKEIVELCKDPRYKMFITKQLKMIGPSMKIGQKYSQQMMPKLMQETVKIMQEE